MDNAIARTVSSYEFLVFICVNSLLTLSRSRGFQFVPDSSIQQSLGSCVPYMLSCPTFLVPHMLSCLTCLVPYVLLCPTCPTCYRGSHASCPTCSCVLRASCPRCSYVPCCFVLCVFYVLISPFLLLSFHVSRCYFFVHLVLAIFWGKFAKVKSNIVYHWSDDQYLSKVWYIWIIWNQIRKHIHMKLRICFFSWLPFPYLYLYQ